MKEKLVLAGLVFLTTLFVWSPFILKINPLPGWGLDFDNGVKTIVANFDGPNYLILAKTWYDKQEIRTQFSNPLPLEYYAAHLPLYPLVVKILDLVMSGPWALMIATLIGSVLAELMFYVYLKEKQVRGAFWISLVFIIFPARWLIVKSVGSPEPWFVFFILASLYYFNKEKYWLAGIFGALSQLTKSPGILLFAAYGIDWLIYCKETKKIFMKSLPVLLIPFSAILLFWFYQIRTGDFWAYFHSGDNFHLFWPPYSIFSPKGQYWTGDFWLEEIILIWLLYGYGVLNLFKQKWQIEGIFAAIFALTTLFIAHRDLSRYILPIAPLMLLSFNEVLNKKEFKIVLVILVIPIFLFTWNFMLNNTAPIADWTPYL